MADRHVDELGGDLQGRDGTSVFGRSLGSDSGVDGAGGAAVATEKVCCVCGKNVAGQKRFKDAEGRYWCIDCNSEDHIRKHPDEGVACPDCNEKFAPSQLTEFDGHKYCEPCATKRRMQKKREDARIAAVAADAREQEARRKQLLIVVAVFVAIVVAAAVWSAVG